MWAETDIEPRESPALWALSAIVSGADRVERVLRVFASIPSVHRSVAPDDPQVLALLGALALCARIRSLATSVAEPAAQAASPEVTQPSLRSVLR